MQDRDKDFDLLIRSMLEDAEARPSRGVWKAISSHLNAEARSKRTAAGGWLRWAGASLALAAALGLALFFSGTVQGPAVHPSRSLALSDNSEPTVLLTDFHSAAPLKAAPVLMQATAEGAEETEPSLASSEEPVSGTMKSQDAAEADKPSRERRKWRKPDSYRNDLDLLAAADEMKASRKGRRTSIYAKGAIGGNDADFRLSPVHSSMAPGDGESGITELSTSTYGIPLTLGVGVRYYLLPKLSIGSGIDYSLLTRTFTGRYRGISSDTGEEIQEAGNISHYLHYIGIPLGLYYDLLDTDSFKLYVYGLGEAEYCLASKYTLFATPNITHGEQVKKLQYSVGGGLGIEFRLSQMLGLYVDPGFRYYFQSDQPKSIRTDKPVMVSFDAGLRFNF